MKRRVFVGGTLISATDYLEVWLEASGRKAARVGLPVSILRGGWSLLRPLRDDAMTVAFRVLPRR